MVIHDQQRKFYFKINGKLRSLMIEGLTGCDHVDTSEEYMLAARTVAYGVGINQACLTVIQGGKSTRKSNNA